MVIDCPLVIMQGEMIGVFIGDVCVAEDAFCEKVACGQAEVDVVEVVAVKATPCVDGGGELSKVVETMWFDFYDGCGMI